MTRAILHEPMPKRLTPRHHGINWGALFLPFYYALMVVLVCWALFACMNYVRAVDQGLAAYAERVEKR